MKIFFTLFLTTISFLTINAQVVINELDCDQPGIDTMEFVELLSDTPNSSLNGYVLVFFNGSTNGMNSSYLAYDLDGFTTDVNGLFVIGSSSVSPVPQFVIPDNLIQNGADAVAIYQANASDFPEGTVAHINNLIDVLIYDTSDADDADMIDIFNDHPNFTMISQINEGSGNNTNSIQRNNDGSYTSTTPTPRRLNDGSGVQLNGVEIILNKAEYNEGETIMLTITTEQNVTADTTINLNINQSGFNSSDFTGSTSVTILLGQNSATTNIMLIDDTLDEGDEVANFRFNNLPSELIALNNLIEVRIIDNDFVVANYGTPLNPTFGMVSSTQPNAYYDDLDGLSGTALRQATQDLIAEEGVVRAQTYDDVFDILEEADQSPENSNMVWLVYTEQNRSKLDVQNTSNSVGKWNREHTFPRSLGGFNSIEADDIRDGIDVYWNTNADSLRHANSDAHGIRASDGPENSARGNQHYGPGGYSGPNGTAGSFRGDVARAVLFLAVRYNGLEIVNNPSVTGQLGDLNTLLDWHRNDPPDDFEMNRNNVVYTWQFNRNPFIDHPNLVEYIFGNNVGEVWNQNLSTTDVDSERFKVYPNPTSDYIFIDDITENTLLNLYNSVGSKMKDLKLVNGKVSIQGIQSGIYFLTIIENNKAITKKIVIK